MNLALSGGTGESDTSRGEELGVLGLEGLFERCWASEPRASKSSRGAAIESSAVSHSH